LSAPNNARGRKAGGDGDGLDLDLFADSFLLQKAIEARTTVVHCFAMFPWSYLMSTTLGVLSALAPQHSNLAFCGDNETPYPLADVFLPKHFRDPFN